MADEGLERSHLLFLLLVAMVPALKQRLLQQVGAEADKEGNSAGLGSVPLPTHC